MPPQAHSYEEIRDVIVDILLGREAVDYEPTQFENLRTGVARVFSRRAGRHPQEDTRPQLHDVDNELVRDVFWDLFRQGHITIGLNDSNREFPHFRLSHFGKKLLASGSPYRFTDASTYVRMVKTFSPGVDDVTVMYLEDAISAFYAGCLLSSCVMLGVAAENLFLNLLDVVETNAGYAPQFQAAIKERMILGKIAKFQRSLTAIISSVPSDIREDLDTQFAAIQSVIRISRNESGHPTGRRLERESVYVLLQLFAPYAKKLAQLESFFRQP